MDRGPHLQSFDLSKRFPDWFELGDKFIEANDIVLQNLSQRAIKLGDVSLYQIILLFNYYKATNSYLAVCRLCDAGLIGDAKTICRKLIELSINMSYLSQKPEQRQFNYWNFAAFSIDKEIVKKLGDDRKGARSVTESERIAQLNAIRDAFASWKQTAKARWERDEAGQVVGAPKRYWSGRNTEEMAKDCGMSWDYIDPYLSFCRSTHVSMDDSSSYFNLQTRAFGPNFEHDDLPAVMHEACRCYWWLTVLAVSAYGLNQVRSLYFLLGEFRKVEARYFTIPSI